MSDAPRPVRRWWAALLFALVVDVAFLGEAILPGRMRAPLDLLAVSGTQPTPHNALLSDWARQFFPWQRRVRESWTEGRFVDGLLWNGDSGFGAPFLANMQCEALSPFLPLLVLAGDEYADWRQLAQMLLAQGLCLLLARRLGLTVGAGLVVGFGWSFSSYMQGWAMHPHTASAAFVPGIAWALLGLRERFTWRRVQAAALCTAGSILSGHLETAAMGGLFAALLAVFAPTDRAGGLRRGAVFLAQAALAGALGILAAAALLLPFLEYLSHSGIETIRKLTPGRPLDPKALTTLFHPFALGRPIGPAAGYEGSHNFIESCVFVGHAVLVLAILGAVLGRRERGARGLVLAILIGGALAFAPASLYAFLKSVPPFDRMPLVRFTFFLTAGTVILAGIGIDRLAAILATRWGERSAGAGRWAAVAICAGQGFFLWHDFVPTLSTDLIAARDRSVLAVPGVRTLPLDTAMPPEEHVGVGVASIRTYDAIGTSRAYRLLFASQAFHGVNWVQSAVGCEPRLLDALGVEAVLAPWPPDRAVIPGEVRVIDAARPLVYDFPAPEGQTLELFLARDGARDFADGTVTVTLAAPGLRPQRLVVGRDAGGARGDLGVFTTEPDGPVLGLKRGPYERIATAYVAFLFAKGGTTATLSIAVEEGGAPVTGMQLSRNGVGRVDEVVSDGRAFFGRRPTALPRAYFATAIVSATDESDAVEKIVSSAFDPHAALIVEGVPPSAGAAPFVRPVKRSDPETGPSGRSFEVTTDVPGYFVLLEMPYPGWAAEVDGVSVPWRPANVIGKAVAVPAGSHVVRFRYTPWMFFLGLGTSAATLLVLGALAFGSKFRMRR